jgi:protein-S-isoprenylcysteine O-methyltransferase Ste14
MRWLETRVPPPVVMGLLGVAAYGAAHSLPIFSLESPVLAPIGFVFLLAGLGLNLIPKFAFKHAGTTVNPLRPAAATSLVTTGIFRYTRNPMYLGQAALLLAFAFYLANAIAFATVPAFVLFISRFQIGPEERSLSVRFPEPYAELCRQAPRWL